MAILEMACPNCSLHAMTQDPHNPAELTCIHCGKTYTLLETGDALDPENPKSQLLRE